MTSVTFGFDTFNAWAIQTHRQVLNSEGYWDVTNWFNLLQGPQESPGCSEGYTSHPEGHTDEVPKRTKDQELWSLLSTGGSCVQDCGRFFFSAVNHEPTIEGGQHSTSFP
jgi:hypothetical protein